MRKYTIHTLKDNEGDFFFGVYEEATEQVIDFFFFQEDAKKTAKFMELGGAFAGFTPSFVLRKVPAKPDLNQKFDALYKD
jgi:hypothetical protein